MVRLFRFVLMFLLLAAAALADSDPQAVKNDKGEQEKPTTAPPPGNLKNGKLNLQAAQERIPGLEGIEAFEMRLRDSELAQKGPNEKSLALIINPFTIRKRGRIFGSVYEYHRNDNFDARNFFDPVGEPLPEYKRNQFGGSLGAFLTEKLQLFGTYDGLRINRGSTILSYVPTPAMKRGDFSALATQLVDPFTGAPFQNNQIPQSRIHPVALKALTLYPDPNRDDASRNFVNNQPQVNNNDSVTARVDYELSRQTKLFANYTLADGAQRKVTPLPEFRTEENQRRQSISINFTHAFSPGKILSTRLSFNRETELELSNHAYQEGLLESLGIEGVSALDAMDEGYPQFEINGYAMLGFGYGGGAGAGSPNTSFRNTYRIETDFTYVRGSHRIGFGADLERRQINDQRTWGTRRGQFGFSGYFTGDGFADFLLGIPDEATRGIGSDRADLRQPFYRAFVRDDWKVNSKLLASIALAYNFTPPTSSVRDNVSFFFPLVFEPPRDGEIIVAGSNRAKELGVTLKPGQAAYPDRNDWEPRFGLAFSPLGNNRLVIRASFGIEYRPTDFRQALSYIGRNYPFFYYEKAESPTLPSLNLSNPFTSAAPAELTVRALDPYMRNSYFQEWQLSLQYEFLRNWNLEATYEGRKGNHLARLLPANVPLPAPPDQAIQPRRPNPSFGRFSIMTSGASLAGHSLDAQVRKRMSGAFSLQSGFRWSRTFSDQLGGDPSNPRDLRSERAFSGYEPPMRFNANFIFDLPVGRGKLLSTEWAGKLRSLFEGWRISGITVIEQGRPFNPRLSGDWNNDGVSGDRPNRIGSGTLPGAERSIDKWFEIAHFVAPDAGGANPQWFGNSGRNILLTPGEYKWDISFLKRTRISDDGDLLEFRVDLFNAFNHTNLERPGTTLGTSTFGVISNAGNAREIEIAVKYSF